MSRHPSRPIAPGYGLNYGSSGTQTEEASIGRGALVPNVRFGSKADLRARVRDVGFTPHSGREAPSSKSPLSAKSRQSLPVPGRVIIGSEGQPWRMTPG
jgi:hypothetical protein